MIASQTLATAMINAGLALYNSGTVKIYEGEYPISPEWGVSSGSTLLATFTFANPAFPNAPAFLNAFGMLAQASLVANSVTPVAAGTACYAFVQESNGNALEQRTVGMPWTPNLAVIPYQFVFANSNTYICGAGGTTAASGFGPAGTDNVIADGSASWKWFAAGAPDVQLTNAALTTSIPIAMPQFALALPCL